MPNTCQAHAQYTPSACPAHAQHMPSTRSSTCKARTKYTFSTHTAHAQHTPSTCSALPSIFLMQVLSPRTVLWISEDSSHTLPQVELPDYSGVTVVSPRFFLFTSLSTTLCGSLLSCSQNAYTEHFIPGVWWRRCSRWDTFLHPKYHTLINAQIPVFLHFTVFPKTTLFHTQPLPAPALPWLVFCLPWLHIKL